jgi:RecA/RadA recombinase
MHYHKITIMAKVKKEKVEQPKPDKKDKVSGQDIALQLLNANKEDHINFEPEVYYKVSTGSFLFDKFLGGGLAPGLHRFGGELPETGKSSEAMQVMYNHLNADNGSVKGVYFDAEGKLNPDIKKRSGIKFTTDPSEWGNRTCLIVQSNVFEFILNFTSTLIKNNAEKTKYCFILDSMDTVGLRDDLAKELEGDAKVAGVPKLFKQYCQKMATALSKMGHLFIIIAQKSAAINIDPYHAADKKQMDAAGGNAVGHQASWVFYFLSKVKDDLILEYPNQKPDIFTNRIIGHKCRIAIKKSTNEKTGLVIYYYVRYGQEDGKSIWLSREISELLVGSRLITKSGAWYKFDEGFRNELIEKGFEVPESIQGMEKVYDLFENDESLIEYIKSKFENFTFEQILNLSREG